MLAAAHEADLVRQIIEITGSAGVHPIIGWPLPDVAALLAEADVFLGNDSGLLNLRAACGRPAFGLFGASGPLRHSKLIVPIVPSGGPRAGMDAITVQRVQGALHR